MAISKKNRSDRDINESDVIAAEETSVNYQKPNIIQRNPNYILILLLMAVSFFSGYLLNKTMTLQKSLVDAKTTQGQAAGAQQAAPTTVSRDKVEALFTKGFIHFGDKNAKLIIAEITDPSCPYCHIAAGHNPELSKQANFQYVSDGGQYTPPLPEIKKLVDEGKAAFAVVYGTGHGNGKLGAEAMYCAFEKGKFWEVHDKLMTNEAYGLLNDQVKNDRSKSQQLADFLANDVDSAFMKDCLESAKYEKSLVRDEQEIDGGLGFQGTPHFVVNETIVNGARDWKDFQPLVDKAT